MNLDAIFSCHLLPLETPYANSLGFDWPLDTNEFSHCYLAPTIHCLSIHGRLSDVRAYGG